MPFTWGVVAGLFFVVVALPTIVDAIVRPRCRTDLQPGEKVVLYDGFPSGSEGIAFDRLGRLFVTTGGADGKVIALPLVPRSRSIDKPALTPGLCAPGVIVNHYPVGLRPGIATAPKVVGLPRHKSKRTIRKDRCHVAIQNERPRGADLAKLEIRLTCDKVNQPRLSKWDLDLVPINHIRGKGVGPRVRLRAILVQ